MTVNEILKYNKMIKSIIDESNEINSLVKFKLLGILKQFEPVVQNFEIIKNDAIMKYGEINEQGVYAIKPPNIKDYGDEESYITAEKQFKESLDKFNEDVDKIAKSEVDIKLSKIKYTDIMNAGVPAEYLVAIYDFIEE